MHASYGLRATGYGLRSEVIYDAGMARVVLTRDEAGCARYAQALAPLGVVALPLTRTEEADDPEALVRALERGGYGAIAVASPRAAEALRRALERTASPHGSTSGALRGPLGAGPVPEIVAVGSATARVLADAGLAVVTPDGVRDAASLAEAIIARGVLRVLVPRAEDGREEGIAILRAAGIEVDDIVAYRTVAVTDAALLAPGRAALATAVACVVFAPSQVMALDALVGVRTLTVPLVAIGETTAAALRERGVDRIAVARTPTPEGVAAAVAGVYPPVR